MAKILIVEDDAMLADLIVQCLTRENHLVEHADNGSDALSQVKLYKFDLIVLDWSLPEVTGIDILKEFRARGGLTPVLFLTGRRDLADKLEGLDAGADDYLTKPFDSRELSSRVRALLRRPAALVGDILQVGPLELDPKDFRVSLNGEDIKLVPKEFALLEFLMRHPGELFAVDKLLDSVWPCQSDSTREALTTCIKRLRKKLDGENESSMIRNVHGVGYGLFVDKAPVDKASAG